ncbi:MAG: dockerin type I repeat-containing protein [Oscillospiraceae bacterium]|nr:dockerin type I repeat-containing protein [Oscillospiraceae bacterium]
MKLKKFIYIIPCILIAETLTAPAMNTNASGNPVLKLRANGQEKYKAVAGETVCVTYEISGGSEWSTSGIHFNYDSRLTPEGSEGDGSIYYFNGEAVESLMLNVFSRTGEDINNNIVKNNPDVPDISPYVSRQQNCVFVTTFSDKNIGKDGVVIGINMIVPDDAQVGDEYKCNFWFLDTDQFTDCEQDSSMQKYAFSNYQDCSIVVGLSPTLRGDANNDNSVDIADVVAIASYVSDSETNQLSEQGIANADVHASGNGINANDALAVQQYIADILTEL